MSHRTTRRPRTVRAGLAAATAVALLAPAAAQANHPAGDGPAPSGVALPNSPYRAPATVDAGGRPAPARMDARTTAPRVLRIASGTAVRIVCQKRGQTVSGPHGTSDLWDLVPIGNGRGAFVSDSQMVTGSAGRVTSWCGGTGFAPDVRQAPDVTRYDGAPAWDGGRNCTAGFTRGASRLQAWLRGSYGDATIGGYSCRPNTADTRFTSIHGVGRANDWMRSASNPTEVASVQSFIRRMAANHAAMARAMGVQYFIWNRQEYHVNPGGITVDGYGGPNPHTDHVHIELNLAGSRLRTSYWR